MIPYLIRSSPRNAFALPRESGDIAPLSVALLNVAYGIAAVKAWAPETFKQRCKEQAKPHYYPEAPNNSGEDEVQRPSSTPEDRRKRVEKRNKTNMTHGGTGAGAEYDYFGMMLGLWSHGMREQRERTEREKKRVNETMVNKWRDTVNY